MTIRAKDLLGWTGLGAALVVALSCMNVAAQEPSASSRSSQASSTSLPLKPVGPGIFEMGRVRLDKKQKTVTFPAVLNQREGIIEYLLVTSQGKTHESLLRTDVEPNHIHLAMLLLGAQGAGTNAFPGEPADPLPGDKITVEVSWRKGGKQTRRTAEELVYSRRSRSAMAKGTWVYTGSQVFEGTFIAQRDGSIIALIADPDALVNNPRPGREDDENWTINKAGLPALETPVQVTFRLSR